MDQNFVKYIDKNGPIPEHKPELGPCWLWTGHSRKDGYAGFTKWHPELEKHKHYLGHRYAYEQFIGPVPEGTTLDHLCRNRGCVNPHHTDPVTHAVNVLRGESFSAINARKTTCALGHTLVRCPWKGRTHTRYCPTCTAINAKARRKAG